jgi:hypothetical protein
LLALPALVAALAVALLPLGAGSDGLIYERKGNGKRYVDTRSEVDGGCSPARVR